MKSLLIAVSLLGQAAMASEGDILFKEGNFTAAGEAFQRAMAADPQDDAARLGLARLELYANHLDRAESLVAPLGDGSQEAARILATIRGRREVARGAPADLPAGGVAVPLDIVDPLPMVTLRLDGREAHMLIDTGAPDLVLDPEFAKEAGIESVEAGVGVFAGGRQAAIRRARIGRAEIGGILLRDLTASVVPARGLKLPGDRRIDGILGTAFLSRFRATLDFPHGRLLLESHDRPFSPPPGAVEVPIWLVGDHMLFAKGTVNQMSDLLLMVDSGLAGGGFAPEADLVAKAAVRTFPERSHKGMGGGGEVTVIPAVADKLCLASACQQQVPGAYMPEGSPMRIFPFAAAGAISHSFLAHYAVTFDFDRMRIWLAS